MDICINPILPLLGRDHRITITLAIWTQNIREQGTMVIKNIVLLPFY